MTPTSTVTFEAPATQLEAYLRALQAWPAGEVALAPHEDAGMAQLLLLRAAALLGRPLWTGWRDGGRVLVWCREDALAGARAA